jgi:hypothetical protein
LPAHSGQGCRAARRSGPSGFRGAAKIYTVLDAIRFNRTDTALVRVVVPVTGHGQDVARRAGERFTAGIFPTLAPSRPN